MRKVLFLLLLLSILPNVVYSQQSEKDIGRQKAEELLITNFGEDYFRDYITYNETVRGGYSHVYNTTVYFHIYNYNIIIDDYSTIVRISVAFDINSNDILNTGGIVNCISDRSLCMPFKINKTEATEIAISGGLKKGTFGYKASVIHVSGPDRYLWTVMPAYPPKSGPGYFVQIDPNSGKILRSSTYDFFYENPNTDPILIGSIISVFIFIVGVFLWRKGKTKKQSEKKKI